MKEGMKYGMLMMLMEQEVEMLVEKGMKIMRL
jgi:hypothetical protein